ncbi:hypothetical protein [Cellvibrio mixtus]|uniref:hypothetical protein n=1 Tax=Cellvibrio mixtus TaxID=39650 RepID=UPI0005879D5C|nr:hypothetical protein [Cellvibrio mixtus]
MASSQLLKTAGIAGIFLHIVLQPVYAVENQQPERDGKRVGPPEEALLACKGLVENDPCSFAGRNDELINGICSLPPRRGETATLACKPDNMPEPPEGGQDGREPPPDRND